MGRRVLSQKFIEMIISRSDFIENSEWEIHVSVHDPWYEKRYYVNITVFMRDGLRHCQDANDSLEEEIFSHSTIQDASACQGMSPRKTEIVIPRKHSMMICKQSSKDLKLSLQLENSLFHRIEQTQNGKKWIWLQFFQYLFYYHIFLGKDSQWLYNCLEFSWQPAISEFWIKTSIEIPRL
jgi:hypothetical protein